MMTNVANQFNTSRQTVHTLWVKAKAQMQAGAAIDVQSKWTGNVGPKRIAFDLQKMSQIPYHKRKNMRSLAFSMQVSKSTVHRWFKSKQIKRHSNVIKPLLTDKGML
ncbi:unnamed protein product [Cuscuta europaea]|uniref:Uncharacterized protein n=1 Tax=Cuscuta europaea TaxID=41803 RepID=A0A9P1A0L2_CUSEU|nr:unnamed protein product [Cuscuta europaea]